MKFAREYFNILMQCIHNPLNTDTNAHDHLNSSNLGQFLFWLCSYYDKLQKDDEM